MSTNDSQDKIKDRLSHLYNPRWARGFEQSLAKALPVRPDLVAGFKLLVITPIIFLGMDQKLALISSRLWLVVILFFVFVFLDYLEETLGREQGIETSFKRYFSRLTDYPLLMALSWFCLGILPAYLLFLKIAIDLVLLTLYFIERGSGRNRLRSGLNYATLIAMLFVSQGFGQRLVTPELVNYLLVANIVFHSIVALYYMNVLQKRFIADVLSGANLLCGVFSMVFAYKGRLDFSLLFLMLGAAFDGFDGAAARKFGGTRWGVYSDDVADAVNYGIAPGAALYFCLPGLEGLVLGPFYTVFTLSRLVFFTLNKTESDPDFFSGVPSTMGGLITLCSLILFPEYPAIVGMMVGVACVLMVSFDTSYRHLGRALSEHRRAFFGMPLLLILLIGGGKLFGVEAPVAMILVAGLAYGFNPAASGLFKLMRNK